jgi:hypothetical protein
VTQFPLFPEPILPLWWAPEDTDVVASYHEWEAKAAGFPEAPNGDCEDPAWSEALEQFCGTLHPRMDEYTCRRCLAWSSSDGVIGNCTVPETPGTLNCGRTSGNNACEQWEPLIPSPLPAEGVLAFAPDETGRTGGAA